MTKTVRTATSEMSVRDVAAIMRDGDMGAVPVVDEGKLIGIVTDRTTFYAQMGGQEGDSGKITVLKPARAGGHADHGEFVVENTMAFGGFVLHIGHVSRGEISVGDTVTMGVDKLRRAQILPTRSIEGLSVLAPGVHLAGQTSPLWDATY